MGNDSKLRVKCSISNCRADEEQRRSGYWGGRQSDEDGRNEYCAKEGERKKKLLDALGKSLRKELRIRETLRRRWVVVVAEKERNTPNVIGDLKLNKRITSSEKKEED